MLLAYSNKATKKGQVTACPFFVSNTLKKKAYPKLRNIDNINAGTVIKWLNSVITYVQK